jgi:hypothetical protein
MPLQHSVERELPVDLQTSPLLDKTSEINSTSGNFSTSCGCKELKERPRRIQTFRGFFLNSLHLVELWTDH